VDVGGSDERASDMMIVFSAMFYVEYTPNNDLKNRLSSVYK